MKQKQLFIIIGLIVLIAGLTAGAYFFLRPSDQEWRNEAGQLHRDNDLPAVIKYHENGEIEYQAWYLNGEAHRDNDKPAEIGYSPRRRGLG